MIDISCSILFGWTAKNIPFQQKIVSYAHLYSYTSVKAVVHWFQIIRAQSFQMYDDEASGSIFGNLGAFYRVAKFPTKNIHSPIVLIYGDQDSPVEYAFLLMRCSDFSIDVMLDQLPPHTVAKKVEDYEHLDLLWGKDVDKVVIPHVLDFLETYTEPILGSKAYETKGPPQAIPSVYSKDQSNGLRKRTNDTAQQSPEGSSGEVTGTEGSTSSERLEELSFANPAAGRQREIESSDSDETM